MQICDESGKSFENEQVDEQFIKHFEKFLGTKDSIPELPEEFVEFNCKLTQNEADDMIKPVLNNEIKEAMFDIDDSKAPGPDGFTSKFFKAA